jgi:hypothetical protein
MTPSCNRAPSFLLLSPAPRRISFFFSFLRIVLFFFVCFVFLLLPFFYSQCVMYTSFSFLSYSFPICTLTKILFFFHSLTISLIVQHDPIHKKNISFLSPSEPPILSSSIKTPSPQVLAPPSSSHIFSTSPITLPLRPFHCHHYRSPAHDLSFAQHLPLADTLEQLSFTILRVRNKCVFFSFIRVPLCFVHIYLNHEP